MANTILIVIGITLILIFYFLIPTRKSLRKVKNEIDEISLAHAKLGYPPLDTNIQLKMMTTGDLTPIAEIIPEYRNRETPLNLLKYYISISKEELSEYIRISGFLEKQKIENAPNYKHDGIWLLKDRIIEQEKGYIHRTWHIKDEEQAAEIIQISYSKR